MFLSLDTLTEILKHLSPKEISQLCQTDSTMRKYCSMPQLQQYIAQRKEEYQRVNDVFYKLDPVFKFETLGEYLPQDKLDSLYQIAENIYENGDHGVSFDNFEEIFSNTYIPYKWDDITAIKVVREFLIHNPDIVNIFLNIDKLLEMWEVADIPELLSSDDFEDFITMGKKYFYMYIYNKYDTKATRKAIIKYFLNYPEDIDRFI